MQRARSVLASNDLVEKDARIVQLLGVGLILVIISSPRRPLDAWTSDLLQNVGTSFVIAALLVMFVDDVVRRHEKWLQGLEDAAAERQRLEDERSEQSHREQLRLEEERRWRPVREHIDHDVLNVARRCALAYRIGVGIGDDDLPRSQFLADGIEALRGTQQWIQEEIIPQLPNLSRLDRARWQSVLEIVDQARQEAERVILLFGDRLLPEVLGALLEVRRETERASQGYQLHQSLLGVPDEHVKIHELEHISEVYRTGLKNGFSPAYITGQMRRVAVEAAEEDAKRVLLSAVGLIDVVVPYFTSERSLMPKDDQDEEMEADSASSPGMVPSTE